MPPEEKDLSARNCLSARNSEIVELGRPPTQLAEAPESCVYPVIRRHPGCGLEDVGVIGCPLGRLSECRA